MYNSRFQDKNVFITLIVSSVHLEYSTNKGRRDGGWWSTLFTYVITSILQLNNQVGGHKNALNKIKESFQ